MIAKDRNETRALAEEDTQSFSGDRRIARMLLGVLREAGERGR